MQEKNHPNINMAAANNVFHVVKAMELVPDKDVYIGLPVEGNNKQAFHRVPIRSSVVQQRTGAATNV